MNKSLGLCAMIAVFFGAMLVLILQPHQRPGVTMHTAPTDGSEQEQIDIGYSTVGMIAEKSGPQGMLARASLADGFLSQREYQAVINLGYQIEKAKVLRRWTVQRDNGR